MWRRSGWRRSPWCRASRPGGIGVLAYVSSRFVGRRLSQRERNGVLLSVFGLAALGVSLLGGSGQGGAGSTAAILVWLGATAAAAVLVVTLGRRALGVAVAEGVAGGLFFSLGDVSTKVATQGGARIAFVIPLILGYTLGTWLLRLRYPRGGCADRRRVGDAPDECSADRRRHDRARRAGSSGVYGALRIIAFAAVTIGAIFLARPERKA